ncbi:MULTISPECIES: glycosyltransferase [unclassified Haloarcula]|uniref:glycosyltransferase n=1 Tax=unclassified Haloarcula TaxID=2624677 RepID=UPI001786CA13|nr:MULTISPECIES: glycosyltransferase [unclassified Haloarcula]
MIPHLEESGIRCDVVSLEGTRQIGFRSNRLKKAYFALDLLGRAPRYDVVFIHRLPLPRLYVTLLEKLSKRIVYDFDDAIYTGPVWESISLKRKEDFNNLIRTASTVIAGSPELQTYAGNYSDEVYCLPTPLPKQKYDHYWNGKEANGEPPRIGWIGNPQNLRYLATITGPLEVVLNQYDDATLDIITAGEKPVTPLVDRNDVTYREWSLDSELDYLSKINIGVRPLSDTEWANSKGGFTSVVQMMALGIPVVVTPVSYLKNIVRHGESGFHASTEEEWIKYLKELIENPKRRGTFGNRGRELVTEDEFWTEESVELLREVLESD